MEDKEHHALNSITSRLKEAQNKAQDPLTRSRKENPEQGNVLSLAFRVSVEIVSAVGIGFVIGWALDRWLESAPWLMVTFVVVGFAAGVLNVYRMASGFGYASGYTTRNETVDANANTDEEN